MNNPICEAFNEPHNAQVVVSMSSKMRDKFNIAAANEDKTLNEWILVIVFKQWTLDRLSKELDEFGT